MPAAAASLAAAIVYIPSALPIPPVNPTLPVRSPTVLFRPMEDGGVLFCSRTEVYFGVNAVGAMIWERLPRPGESQRHSFDDIVRSLQDSYAGVDRETLEADVREFLQAMIEGELVVSADDAQD